MRKIVQDVDERLQEFKLTDRADLPAGQLSHGEQRGLEIALSVIADPVVLLLDEPLAGVGHGEMARYVDLLRRVAASRTTVVVEHNMDIVMDLADEIVCLTGGNVLAKGSPREIRGNEQVRAAYLGTADA
jgi:branched-chain amino acid transport system ATP-binding protein